MRDKGQPESQDEGGGSASAWNVRRLIGQVVRKAVRDTQWAIEYQRLRPLTALGRDRRAFLLGNGPSLASMDLSKLDREFVCVVNMGIRALGAGLSHADMHVVLDSNRYRRFQSEIEETDAEYNIRLRFLTRRSRHDWRARGRDPRPYFVLCRPGVLDHDKVDLNLRHGLSTGASVVPSAALLLGHMGFGRIYVIGCDLDYETAGPYFYGMEELDVVHEQDSSVIYRRQYMSGMNGQFGIVSDYLAKLGAHVFNAGVGGNLQSLVRVDFEGLFAQAPPTAGRSVSS